MKTLVLYYSYSGHAKKLAEACAKKKKADIAEIKDANRPGTLGAYLKGCPAAIKGKSWLIQPIDADLAAYDSLILYSPVWAGNPPPAVNAALKRIPRGKDVAVYMVSRSGTSKCRARLEELVAAKGSKLAGFNDLKG